jgi:TRAP-type transport system periplasmic protein
VVMPLRAAGYQGPGSILTRALHVFADALADGPTSLACVVEDDVTAAGETARSLFDSIEAGERQVGYMASGYLSARVPALSALDLPFTVHDRASAMASLDGAVGASLDQEVGERSGLKVLGFWDNGFRHLTNKRHPIRAPADCLGLKVRTIDSADYRATLAALGFEPLSIDVRELVSAVAGGRVDAQENPLANYLLFEIWRHHRFVSLTSHLFGVALLICHAAWWHMLSADQQQRVLQAARKSCVVQRRLAAEEDQRALAVMKTLGMEVSPASSLDLTALKACCQSLVAARRLVLPSQMFDQYVQS